MFRRRSLNAGQPMCSLSWDPKRNALLTSDRDGRVMQPWTGVVPGSLPPPYAACMPRAPVAQEEEAASAQSPKKPAGAFEEDEADEDGQRRARPRQALLRERGVAAVAGGGGHPLYSSNCHASKQTKPLVDHKMNIN